MSEDVVDVFCDFMMEMPVKLRVCLFDVLYPKFNSFTFNGDDAIVQLSLHPLPPLVDHLYVIHPLAQPLRIPKLPPRKVFRVHGGPQLAVWVLKQS